MDTPEIRTAEHKASDILRRRQLSITESRKKILSLFLRNNDALAHADIESKSEGKYDRVTIYRTLQTFVEKGILHTVPTAENSVLYALCKDCTEGHHHDDHIHFYCTSCRTTTCLDDVVSPKITLPEGYQARSIQVLIEGVCRNCRK